MNNWLITITWLLLCTHEVFCNLSEKFRVKT